MTLEGLHEFEEVRDFLYSKMRGVRGGAPAAPHPATPADPSLAAALREVAAELRAVREALERR
jgi:putative membrane protein